MVIRNKSIVQFGRCYIVGEMSANHGRDFQTALNIVRGLARVGADAVKIQIYDADDLTVNCDKESFIIKSGLWAGKNLYELYQSAVTPMDWIPQLKAEAHELGMGFIASVYNQRTLDMALDIDVDAIKIASFENEWYDFIDKLRDVNKPVIISLGGLNEDKIDRLDLHVKQANTAYLVCSSRYPSTIKDIDFKLINYLSRGLSKPIGLSDHTLDSSAVLVAKALGASIIEKHVKSNSIITPDSAFSLSIPEFGKMIDLIRQVENNLDWNKTLRPHKSPFKRSVYTVKPIKAGDTLDELNIAVMRPSGGLEPREFESVMGKTAVYDIAVGTPLKREMIK